MIAAAAVDDERLRRAADLLLAHRFRGWFFGDSIGFEGLLAASDLLGDERWASFVHGFVRAWATRALPYRESDNTAPGHAICLCYERTGDAAVLDAACRLADFLTSRRRVRGVFITSDPAPLAPPYGPVSLGAAETALLRAPGAGVFLDCLHFDPPFFVHLGRLTGDRALVQLGVEQATRYLELLHDPGTGLLNHFWLERTGAVYAPGWARGQGWALLGLLDLLALLEQSVDGRDRIAEGFRSLCAALFRYQRPDGHWHAVAQEPASGDEHSTAAFAATALRRGIDLGLLDRSTFDEPARRAWNATLGALDGRGVLTKVSAAVGACTALEHYGHVPTGHLVPWGQGPVLTAARAWSRHG